MSERVSEEGPPRGVRRTCVSESGSRMKDDALSKSERSVVGTLWSTVANLEGVGRDGE